MDEHHLELNLEGSSVRDVGASATRINGHTTKGPLWALTTLRLVARRSGTDAIVRWTQCDKHRRTSVAGRQGTSCTAFKISRTFKHNRAAQLSPTKSGSIGGRPSSSRGPSSEPRGIRQAV